jgi:hypothetical protein
LKSVFLSASVPLPNCLPRFLNTADVVGIREAIKAMVGEVLPEGTIVYGGHPAITPLMALLLRGLGTDSRGRITLYQSAYFAEHFVKENDEFVELRMIRAMPRSKKRSLDLMRRRMIGDNSFDVGVFIGGMEGSLEEYRLFKFFHPRASVWPIASTGAAARELFESIGRPRPDLFLDEITYSTLFRRLFSEMRNGSD